MKQVSSSFRRVLGLFASGFTLLALACGSKGSSSSSASAEPESKSSTDAADAMRAYRDAAKAAEAKSTIGAIARAAVAAYEREDASALLDGPGEAPAHKLCPSAPPVPTAVPRGVKYQPSSSQGADFQQPSWQCLRFTLSMPHYYQYEYRTGGPYKGPSRGGPDPGPDGFEVSAEGDLDGDGVTSLFTMTGKVDSATKSVRLATELFVADETE